jgi:hypothetical protein
MPIRALKAKKKRIFFFFFLAKKSFTKKILLLLDIVWAFSQAHLAFFRSPS